MKRHWVYALAVLVALPRLAHAQGDPGWGPRLRITPFVGVSPGTKQNGVVTFITATNNNRRSDQYRLELPSSLPMGVNVEYRFWRRFSVIGGGAWSTRGRGTLLDFEDIDLPVATERSNFWMAKLDAAMRLREVNPEMQLKQLNASIFIGPAYIRDVVRNSLTTPFLSSQTVGQMGLNVGADAELPLANNRMAFQLGLEDWMIFWSKDDYQSRMQGYLQENYGAIAAIAIDPNKTHLWILRGGLSFRF